MLGSPPKFYTPFLFLTSKSHASYISQFQQQQVIFMNDDLLVQCPELSFNMFYYNLYITFTRNCTWHFNNKLCEISVGNPEKKRLFLYDSQSETYRQTDIISKPTVLFSFHAKETHAHKQRRHKPIKTATYFQTVTSWTSMIIWPFHSTLQFTSMVEMAYLSNPHSRNNYMSILASSSISLSDKYSVPYFKQAVRGFIQ
jgi:hypothetical protein